MSSQEYNVELINETDSDAVMNLLQRTFFIEEPKVKAIGLFESGSCPEMEDICRKSWLDPLSISVKAVDAEGNIVGVFISGPVNLKENSSQVLIRAAETCKNEKFKKYVHVLTKRDEELVGLVEKYPEEEQILFVKLVATDPAWRNKGIMKVLLERTEQIARQKRFRLIRMDTTNAFSASYAERNGFTCVYKVKLADIKMNGESLIVPEEPHIYDRVFIKDLLS